MSNITDFFDGSLKIKFGIEPDILELTAQELIEKDDFYFEGCHNHMQWLFPTVQKSEYNPDAPILTKEDAEKLIFSDVYIAGIKRFIQFLKQANLSYFNHNFLRISRMLQSIALVYGRDESVRTLAYILQLKDLQYNNKSLISWYQSTLVTWDNPTIV